MSKFNTAYKLIMEELHADQTKLTFYDLLTFAGDADASKGEIPEFKPNPEVIVALNKFAEKNNIDNDDIVKLIVTSDRRDGIKDIEIYSKGTLLDLSKNADEMTKQEARNIISFLNELRGEEKI